MYIAYSSYDFILNLKQASPGEVGGSTEDILYVYAAVPLSLLVNICQQGMIRCTLVTSVVCHFDRIFCWRRLITTLHSSRGWRIIESGEWFIVAEEKSFALTALVQH